ncbi:coat protein [Vanilla virus X]|uniref:Coat protein n=1 Tax=Vanilla virus X TaxID=2016427 RepID=A0A220NQ80_9VIRU|nr:coat protein [Vanilla virus X]ASJ78786.1 coat protein [Vanilla virus X]
MATPAPTPTPATNTADPFAEPSESDLKNLKVEIVSNAVATRAQITAIATAIKAVGVADKDIAPTFWDVARHCADVGSSPSVILRGKTPFGVERRQIAGIITGHCTLRQFCMFYAKIVWNIMLLSDTPPANWQAQNYRVEDRFAAFDFFTGVSHTAALNPKSGLLRAPTPEEILANQTNARVSIFRARAQQNNKATTAVEVTGGQLTGGLNPVALSPP